MKTLLLVDDETSMLDLLSFKNEVGKKVFQPKKNPNYYTKLSFRVS